MSYISFDSLDEQVLISGAERYNYRHLVVAAFRASLGTIYDTAAVPSAWRKLLKPKSSLHQVSGEQFGRFFALHIESGEDDEVMSLNGDTMFTTALNTAMVLGGDALSLAARLHGQCEINCYVEGEDRAWLADIIEHACNQNIFRRWNAASKDGRYGGYDALIKMLRSRSDTPVVCSHSSGNEFPWSMVPKKKLSEDADDWCDDDRSKQALWPEALVALRASGGNRRISPDSMDILFGGGTTGFDLTAFVESEQT